MTEDIKRIQGIESEIIAPALYAILEKIKQEGYAFNDCISAMANAYHNMLVELIGKDKTRDLLAKQAEFLSNEK